MILMVLYVLCWYPTVSGFAATVIVLWVLARLPPLVLLVDQTVEIHSSVTAVVFRIHESLTYILDT